MHTLRGSSSPLVALHNSLRLGYEATLTRTKHESRNMEHMLCAVLNGRVPASSVRAPSPSYFSTPVAAGAEASVAALLLVTLCGETIPSALPCRETPRERHAHIATNINAKGCFRR